MRKAKGAFSPFISWLITCAVLMSGAGLLLHLFFNVLPQLIVQIGNRFLFALGYCLVVSGYQISLVVWGKFCIWLHSIMGMERHLERNGC